MDLTKHEGADMQVDDMLQLWKVCVDLLKPQISEAAWKTCFEGLRPLTLEHDILVLQAPSALARERLDSRYRPLLEAAITTASPTPIYLELRSPSGLAQLDSQLFDPEAIGTISEHVPLASSQFDAHQEPPNPTKTFIASGQTRPPESPLNPRYTFEAFVIGASNRFAHAAAMSVAEAPARSYNPLFIHGAAGLGKTHLLHAIGNYVTQNFPGRAVRYVSTETFMNDFVEAIRSNTTAAFKKRYRECDVLLVDDVQFMEKKEGLQEEFFHTFNSLYEASRQIVITSDRPPKSIATLEDRLRSRFLSGLTTDVQPPELETRIAILRSKADAEGVNIPAEVLDFIGVNIRDNIRELEGALIRVCAFASLNSAPLTLPLAEQVLSDMVGTQARIVTPVAILNATAEAFGFTVEELKSASRRRPLVTARQVGMYVFRELTDFSYPAIAKEFGGRDHTTVMHAVDKISALMKERRQIYDQVTELLTKVRAGV